MRLLRRMDDSLKSAVKSPKRLASVARKKGRTQRVPRIVEMANWLPVELSG